jgi:hypothetical protein
MANPGFMDNPFRLPQEHDQEPFTADFNFCVLLLKKERYAGYIKDILLQGNAYSAFKKGWALEYIFDRDEFGPLIELDDEGEESGFYADIMTDGLDKACYIVDPKDVAYYPVDWDWQLLNQEGRRMMHLSVTIQEDE